jgi:hypothetical protein
MPCETYCTLVVLIWSVGGAIISLCSFVLILTENVCVENLLENYITYYFSTERIQILIK